MILRVMSYDKHSNTFLCTEPNKDEPIRVNLTACFGRGEPPAHEKFIGRFVKVDTCEPEFYLGTNTRFIDHKEIGKT